MTEEHEERASLYILGLLESAEAASFEGELNSNSELRQTVQNFRNALSSLSLSLPPERPPEHVKTNILQRIRGKSPNTITGDRKGALLEAVLPLAHSLAFLDWKPAEPGVEHCFLRGSHDAGTAVFYRIQPGYGLPRHKHVGAEDCLILQGSLRDGSTDFHAGMYLHYAAGTEHRDFKVISDTDCILFVVHGGVTAPDSE